ncbi:MAG: T9SS type A sorting domain-containing protein, partial [Flavobacteriales bacterium]|nr:T9SS type A sorting domain-containing protein [Flavobacteriales bacterium]
AFAAGYRTDGSEGFILISADGGMTWDLNYSTAGLNNSRRIYGLFFHDDFTGYAATHIKPHKTSGLITGLTERGSEDLMLFPNPSDHSSTLRFDDTSTRTVEVYDPLGRVVHRSRTNSASLELSKPGAAGSYLVRVVGVDGVRTGRWLVQ